VLSGVIKETGELKEKYWPEGEWPHYMAIKVSAISKSILENRDTKSWKSITREELKKFNFRPFPGIQKLEDKIGEDIEIKLES